MLAQGPVSWFCCLQSVVALSSTEAELIALTEATCQALYLRRLGLHLGLDLSIPTTILCDNQSTLTVIQKPPYTYQAWLKHYAIKDRFIYDNGQNSSIKLHYVPSNENLADILTKALPTARLRELKDLMNLRTPK